MMGQLHSCATCAYKYNRKNCQHARLCYSTIWKRCIAVLDIRMMARIASTAVNCQHCGATTCIEYGRMSCPTCIYMVTGKITITAAGSCTAVPCNR